MGKRVLLADDSLTIQKLVEMALSDTKHQLLGVTDGQQAIERMEEFQPDIVLADAIMPLVDGYQLCQAVKKHPKFSHVPVVLLLGRFQPYDEGTAIEAGIDAKIIKPFLQEQLVKLIEDLPIAKPAAPEPLLPPGFDENATVQYNPDALRDMVLKDAAKAVSAADLPSLDDFNEEPEPLDAFEEPHAFEEELSDPFAESDLDSLPSANAFELEEPIEAEPLAEPVESSRSPFDDETVHVDALDFAEPVDEGSWNESHTGPQEFEAEELPEKQADASAWGSEYAVNDFDAADLLPESPAAAQTDFATEGETDFGAADLVGGDLGGSDFADTDFADSDFGAMDLPSADQGLAPDESSFRDVAEEIASDQGFVSPSKPNPFGSVDFGVSDFGSEDLGSDFAAESGQMGDLSLDDPYAVPGSGIAMEELKTGTTMELDESDLEDVDVDLVGDELGFDEIGTDDLHAGDLEDAVLGEEPADQSPEVQFDMAEPAQPYEMNNSWDMPTAGIEPRKALPAEFDAWSPSPDEAAVFDPSQDLASEEALELEEAGHELAPPGMVSGFDEDNIHSGHESFEAPEGEIALEVDDDQPLAEFADVGEDLDESPLSVTDPFFDEADTEEAAVVEEWHPSQPNEQEVVFDEDEELLTDEGDEVLDLEDEASPLEEPPATQAAFAKVEPESDEEGVEFQEVETPSEAAFAAPQKSMPAASAPAASVPAASVPAASAPAASAPAASAPAASAPAALSAELDEKQLDLLADKIVTKLIEKLGHAQIREIAWEVIPEIAEAIIKKRIFELEKSAEHPN